MNECRKDGTFFSKEEKYLCVCVYLIFSPHFSAYFCFERFLLKYNLVNIDHMKEIYSIWYLPFIIYVFTVFAVLQVQTTYRMRGNVHF